MLGQSSGDFFPGAKLLRLFATISEPLWRKTGLFHRLRFKQRSIPQFVDLKAAANELLDTRQTPVNFPEKDQSIVIVGAGPAAFHAVKWAKQRGFTQITLVQENEDAIGGKCVNRGCMPSEFFMASPHLSLGELNARFTVFRNRLRSSIQKELQTLCAKIVFQKAVAIEGNRVLTGAGASIEFDALVLANGQSEFNVPNVFSDTLSLEGFWELSGGPLTIIVDGNLTGLSLASIALKRGLAVQVLVLKRLPFGHLPAVQFFLEALKQDGVSIEFATRVETINNKEAVFITDAGARCRVNHAAFLYQGTQSFQSIPIDGQSPDLQEVDLRWLKIRNRSNVFVIGDAAGFLSAAEAEVSAQALIDMWCEKVPANSIMPTAIPVRIHASSSLAMIGDPLTYLQEEWQQVDFSYLGWTAVHQRNGALWFQCKENGMVTAMHICHPDAAELISLGTALMRFPVQDPIWSSAFAHPSSAEIFRLVRARVLELASHFVVAWANTEPQISLRRSEINRWMRSSQMASDFSTTEMNVGRLDQNPLEYFVVLAGLKQIFKADGKEARAELKRSSNGSLVNSTDPTALSYVFNPAVPAAKISWKAQSIFVRIV